MSEQKSLVRTVEGRLKSARDLFRLKNEGLGILPTAECPTCQQLVDPSSLALSEQSIQTVELYAQQLDRERTMLIRNVERIEAEALEEFVTSRRLDEELAEAERAVQLVNHTIGPAREVIVKAANDLVATERELDRVRQFRVQIETLIARMKEWANRENGVTVSVETSEDDGLEKLFVDALQRFVVALGCAGIGRSKSDNVGLDDRYTPVLAGRWVRSLGSASDRARLIVAYLWSLLDVGQNHLGFLVLDEPLQQNPDPNHRFLFLEFLRRSVSSKSGQVVIFTNLSSEEVTDLQRGGVSVQALSGKFLRLLTPD